MSFISSSEISQLLSRSMNFLLNSASFAETAAVIPNGAKIFFANGTATFVNGAANLLDNDSKNPPD